MFALELIKQYSEKNYVSKSNVGEGLEIDKNGKLNVTVDLNEDLCRFLFIIFIINKVKQKVNILTDIIKNEQYIPNRRIHHSHLSMPYALQDVQHLAEPYRQGTRN